MTYKKPNVRYIDMCIWIDSVVYTDECDDVKLFEYLYHIINMLAHQGAYFKNARYYDEFALNGATRVFLRLKNKKQFEYLEDGVTPVLPKIKSVLNYVKSILYPMKVVFETQAFAQVSKKPSQEVEYNDTMDIQVQMQESVDRMRLIDFNVYLQDVVKTCKAFLKKIPHKNDDSEWENIYLSCLLTFLNSVTLSNKNKERIQDMKRVLASRPQLIDKLYREERSDCVILYHLKESMRPYVTVLYNRVKHLIAKDLSVTLEAFVPSEVSAKNLLVSSLWEERNDETFEY